MENNLKFKLCVLILICTVIVNDTTTAGALGNSMSKKKSSLASKSTTARIAINTKNAPLSSVSTLPHLPSFNLAAMSTVGYNVIRTGVGSSTQALGANLGASSTVYYRNTYISSKAYTNRQIRSTCTTMGITKPFKASTKMSRAWSSSRSVAVIPGSKSFTGITKNPLHSFPISSITNNTKGRLLPKTRIVSVSIGTVPSIKNMTGNTGNTLRASQSPQQQPNLQTYNRPEMTQNENSSWPTTQPILMIRYDELKFLPQSLSPDLVATFMVLYIFIIFLAFFGNLLVIFVLALARMVRSFTDLFILSLAVSDILISTLNMPLQLNLIVTNEWKMGSFLCKFTNYLQAVTIVANILTLTVIAVDRYLVICHSEVSRKIHTKRFAVLGLIVVWSVSLCVVCPQLIVQRIMWRIKIDLKTQTILGIAHVCVESFPKLGKHGLKIYSLTIFLGAYLGPVCVMVFTYGAIAHRLWVQHPIGDVLSNSRNHARSIKQKRKVIKMLMLLVVAFTILWFPFFTASLYKEFVKTDSTFRITMDFLQLIGYSNCCFNPIIYTFLNKKFQVEFKKIFCRRRRRTVITSIHILEYRSRSNPHSVHSNLHSTTHSSSHDDVIVQGLGKPVACLHV